VTDPGSINYFNNLDILEFYYFIYRDINLIIENAKLNGKTNDYDEDYSDNYYNRKKRKRNYNYSDDDKYEF
jgi:hypothetical protein